MKYGFIGAGNISSAVIIGAVNGGISPKDIIIFDTDASKIEKLCRDTGVCSGKAKEIIESSKIIFYGLKPYVLPDVLSEHAAELARRTDNPIVVSFAAGIGLDKLNMLLPDVRFIRVMPNINSAVCAGNTAMCANSLCNEKNIATVTEFMSAGGSVVMLEEKFFDIFSVLGGSTPAFCYIFIDSLARAALSLGMPKNQALNIAAQSVLGSAKLLLESGEHPWELADRVCSPGGLTVEGIRALQEGSFEHTVMQALIRAVGKIK